jgi:hypothetical protein
MNYIINFYIQGGPNGGPLMPPQMDGGRNGKYTLF